MKTYSAKRCGAVPVIVALLLLFAIISGAITYFLHNNANPPSLPDNGIKKFSTYEELEKYLKASSGGNGYYGGGIMTGQMAVKSTSSEAVPGSAGGAPDYSRTNIQVEGVDEADIVKSDGKYIYAVSGGKVTIVDAYPAESAKKISEIDFKGSVREIFVNGNKLVVFGQKYEAYPVLEKESSETAAKAEKMMARPDIYPGNTQKTSVTVYDISDRYHPRLAGDFLIGGNYYNSRMIGNYVYVIASQQAYYSEGSKIAIPELSLDGRTVTPSSFPDIYYFDGVPGNVFTTIAAINLDIMGVTSKIILTNYAGNMYVSEKNIYITYTKWLTEADYIDKMVDVVLPLVPSDIKAKIKAVMATDMSKQIKWQAVGEILNKYSATLSEEERRALEEKGRIKMEELQRQMAKEREKTVVQRLEIGSGKIDYKANGEVPGNTLNQFSMDEHNGFLRVATTTSGNGGVMIARTMAVEERTTQAQVAERLEQIPESTGMAISEQTKPSAGVQTTTEARVIAPSPPRGGPANNIYVLDSDLKIVGSVEDLAPGEKIYSVRFLGDKAYMVTFRQTDPLFVIDLSSPDNPLVLGYLKIPGVSDYLHPYDETHVIGVGRDATDQGRLKGMKLSLFDVSDFSKPTEISKYIIGEQGTDSDALRDHKAFLFSREKNLLVIPVSEYRNVLVGAPEVESMPKYWQGAYVFNIDLAGGITLKGKITHNIETEMGEKYHYDYATQIRRSLYIGDILYTLSQKMLMINSLHDLRELGRISLPYESYEGKIMY